MVKITTKAKNTAAGAARRGVETVRSVASDVLGAAAKAAATVAIESAVEALGAGRANMKQAAPAIRRSAGRLAKRAVRGTRRKKRSTRPRAKSRRRTAKRAKK